MKDYAYHKGKNNNNNSNGNNNEKSARLKWCRSVCCLSNDKVYKKDGAARRLNEKKHTHRMYGNKKTFSRSNICMEAYAC